MKESMSESAADSRSSGIPTRRSSPINISMVLLGLPVMLFMLMAIWSVPYVDPIRDANRAWLIAQGLDRPLTGPPVAGLIHLGPIWFYLLSLPARLASSILGISLFVAVLAASKFIFAFLLGRRLANDQTGLLLAFGLLLPSWSFWQFLFLTHPVMVEAAILASGVLLLAYLDQPGAGRATWLGLALGLGLHAHPTFVLALPALLALVHWHGGWRAARWSHALLACAVILCLFLPALVGQWTEADTSLQRVSGFVGSDIGDGGPTEVIWTAWSLFVTGVQASFHLSLPGRLASGAYWVWTLWLLFLITAWACAWRVISPAERRLWLGALASLLVALLILTLLRSRTPWYMTWALMPMAVTLLAITIHGVGTVRPLRWLPAASICLLVALHALAVIGFIKRVDGDSELSIPAVNLFDVTNTRLEWSDPGLVIPARHAGEVGAYLCQHPEQSIGGILGTVLDERTAIDALLFCGSHGSLRVGPCGENAVLGLPHSAWQQMGIEPDHQLSVAGLLSAPRLSCHAGGPSLPMADASRYPFRPVFSGLLQAHHAGVQLAPLQFLAVINQFPVLNGFDDLEVSLGGVSVAPIWRDRSTAIFECKACDQTADWHVEFKAVQAEQVYLLGISRD